MLSEIVAKRLALAARPATPAFSEDEIVMKRLSVRHHLSSRILRDVDLTLG